MEHFKGPSIIGEFFNICECFYYLSTAHNKGTLYKTFKYFFCYRLLFFPGVQLSEMVSARTSSGCQVCFGLKQISGIPDIILLLRVLRNYCSLLIVYVLKFESETSTLKTSMVYFSNLGSHSLWIPRGYHKGLCVSLVPSYLEESVGVRIVISIQKRRHISITADNVCTSFDTSGTCCSNLCYECFWKLNLTCSLLMS